MPCESGYTTEQITRMRIEEAVDTLKKELDLTTNMLCALCRRLENSQDTSAITYVKDDSVLHGWWLRHKKQDAIREAKEEKKRTEAEQARLAKIEKDKKINEALSKLTLEEQEALGLEKKNALSRNSSRKRLLQQ